MVMSTKGDIIKLSLVPQVTITKQKGKVKQKLIDNDYD